MKRTMASGGRFLAVLFFSLLAVPVWLEAQSLDDSAATGDYDWDTYAYFKEHEVTSLQELASDYVVQQWIWMPIAFPEDVPWGWTQVADPNPMPFAPAGFPQSFFAGLLPRYLNGVMVFPVYVWEDPKTRARVFFNANYEEIATVAADLDYNPTWWLYALFNEGDRAGWSRDDWRRYAGMFDSSRLVIRYNLILDRQLQELVYVPEEANASLMAAEFNGGGEMLLMRLLEADTDIIIQSAAVVSNNVKLEIAYPNDFTNRLEIYATTNLSDYDWSLAATNLATTGTNAIFWTDTGTTNYFRRFYAAGNADLDSDGDGLVDGREKYLYGSSMDERDSDGDGLVDGYSGVVGTNAYAAGARTNGGIFVEGELTWYTEALISDTDDDGMGDGWEVSNGHNPLDPNDPPNANGTITYSGGQTGQIWIMAVTSSNNWATNLAATIAGPGTYRISNITPSNYWIKAYRDSNGNGVTNSAEAWGWYATNSTPVTNRLTGIDITLADPDRDSDSLPDWWENQYFGSTTNSAGTDDPDGDFYNNLDEYQAGTDPTNTLSHPWNISGTITYDGPQTGTIWVIAGTSSASWVAAQYSSLASTGAYTITHLPPNTNYWIRVWRDSTGNGINDFGEAVGEYASNPVYLTTNLTQIDITLADLDGDADGLPDWWEQIYGLDPDNGGGTTALAWWKLNETAGTNVLDSTVNTNNGILFGGISSAWTQGVISNALVLDGTNRYVQINDSASLCPTYLSVALWIKPNRDYTNDSAVFFTKKQPGAAMGYELSYTNGRLSFLVCATGNKSVSVPYALSPTNWYHLTGTYGGDYQSLYVNGSVVAVTNWDWGASSSVIQQTNTTPRIGASADNVPSNLFAGVMDDIQVYDHELTSNEVYGIYEVGQDTDGDGLSNWREYQLGSNPTNTDSDADGMPDAWEAQNGFSPINGADAMADADGDGYPNIYEFKHSSDPQNGASIPVPNFTVTNGVNTIQSKINLASNDYDIVLVMPGTYTNAGNKDLDFAGKKILLISSGGPTGTTIDCQRSGRGFYFHSGEGRPSVVYGLTFRNGNVWNGGGVYCTNAGPTIRNCALLANCASNNGAGIMLLNSDAEISGSQISNNGTNQYVIQTYNGGGIYIQGGTPLVSNCTIQANQVWLRGAGVYASNTLGTIDSCQIEFNSTSSDMGGGIYVVDRLRVANSQISGNSAHYNGGGICGLGAVVISDCWISENNLVPLNEFYGGAGVYLEQNAVGVPMIQNSIVMDNYFGSGASGYGGGLFLKSTTGTILVQGCTIHRNHATGGAGVYSYLDSRTQLEECDIIANNAEQEGGGVFGNQRANVAIDDSYIAENTSSNGGGISASFACIMAISNTTVSANQAAFDGGGLHAHNYATTGVDRCLFSSNVAARSGGGIFGDSLARVSVSGSELSENSGTTGGGGGIMLGVASIGSISSSLITGNQAYQGGGIQVNAQNAIVQNCTITANHSTTTNTAGGVYSYLVFGTNIIRNCIVWSNSTPQIDSLVHTSGYIVSYSCIQGGFTNAGATNIVTSDPDFYLDGWHLQSTNSPCFNAGSTNSVPAYDLDGEARLWGGAVDIGADEWRDTDGDGLPDWWEIKYFGGATNAVTSEDSDGDGLTNLDEYRLGTAPTVPDTGDADSDGLMDGAEISLGTDPNNPDTDGDGMTDGWEVDNGLDPLVNDTTGDLDFDGLSNLDEWYLGTSPANTDSDADGLSDGAEVSGSVLGYVSDPTNPDTDGDGIPDGQDLFTSSPQGDQDGDGIPDAVDTDDDNDGVVDANETYGGAYPSVSGGGTFALYPDSDGEGVPDGTDYDPDNPAVWQDPGSPDITPPNITLIAPQEGAVL